MTLDDQPRLFLPAVGSVNLTSAWSHPDGWHVRVAHRHEGDDTWAHESYDRLTSEEATSVAEAALGAIWGGCCSCRA